MSITSRNSQWLAAVCAFLVIGVLASVYLVQSERQSMALARSRAADLAADHAQTLQLGLQQTFTATYALAALLRQGDGVVLDFEVVANELLRFYPGIAALALSPGGIISQVAPLKDNESSLGFDQFRDEIQSAEAIKARDTRQLTLAGPLKLAQGGWGVVARLPVFLGGPINRSDFWGFTNVTLKFPQALTPARFDVLVEQGYAYELWRTVPGSAERQVIDASGTTELQSPVNRTLKLPNGEWTLSVAPQRGWSRSDKLGLKVSFALLISLLAAYLAWLLREMKLRDDRLEMEVRQRTGEILTTQHHLEATLRAVPDPLFEMDLEGRYYSAQVMRPELLPQPVDSLLGRTVNDILAPDAAITVLRALHEAHVHGWSTGMQFKQESDSGQRWFELSVARKAQVSGESLRFMVLSRDITENKQAEEQIRQLAHYDALTLLPNRALLGARGH